MKKFVGNVNGESFDNVEKFQDAAEKAIKDSKSNLNISLYYKEIEDDDKEKKDTNHLPSSEYIDTNSNPPKENGEYFIPLKEDLKKKLIEATNDNDIEYNLKTIINMYETSINNTEMQWKNQEAEIEKQKKLFETTISRLEDDKNGLEENHKKLWAKKDYYTRLLAIIQEKIKAREESETEERKEPVDEQKPNKRDDFRDIRSIIGLNPFDFLREIGFIW